MAGETVTDTAPNNQAKKAHRLDIQGLRAIAVLMVVAFHAGLPVPGGFVGVDVFFVISGFVITAMLMREWAASGRIRLGRFYARRFKRLTPALAVTVAVVMLASVLLLSPFGSQQIAAQTGLGAMLLVANVAIARSTGGYFDAPAESNPLLNTWSLSVEEQFYLIFPAILLLGWLLGKRSDRPQRSTVAVVASVGAVSFALAVAGAADLEIPLLPDSLVGFYGPATRAWEFAVGALLALGGAKLHVAAPRPAAALASLGALMLAASLWLITGATPFPGVWTLLPVIGTLLLIAAGTSNTLVPRALASAPMVAIGDRSYSIYLWHWPFIVFAHLLWPGSPLAAPAAAVLSLLPAYASYRWVEQPFRNLKVTGGMPLARLVAATVLPPLLLAGGLGLAARNGFWTPGIQESRIAIQTSHAAREAGCDETDSLGEPDTLRDCTWNSTASGKPVYLLGDSNAAHFSEAVIIAAKNLGRPVIISTPSSCPFVDVPVSWIPAGATHNARCRTWVADTLQQMRSKESGTVILASSDVYWSPGTKSEVGGSTDGNVKLRLFEGGLGETVRNLQSAGHTVVLVQTVPHWGDSMESLDWTECSTLDLFLSGCANSMSLHEVTERQGAVANVVAAVARARSAFLLDLDEAICPDRVCSAVTSSGLITYRDGTHITVRQSEQLADEFQSAISSAG